MCQTVHNIRYTPASDFRNLWKGRRIALAVVCNLLVYENLIKNLLNGKINLLQTLNYLLKFVIAWQQKIALEIRSLNQSSKEAILNSTPISLIHRIEELQAFQSMMEIFNRMQPRPELVRTQIITQNYIAFVYLKDTLFEALRKVVPAGSLTKKML